LPAILLPNRTKPLSSATRHAAPPQKQKARKLYPGAERNFLPTQYITAVKCAGVSRTQSRDRRPNGRAPQLVTIMVFAAYTNRTHALKARAARIRAAHWHRAFDVGTK
jgi:hypothetical protein